MNELTRLSIDTVRAELAYRQCLLTGDARRTHRSTKRWWDRIALVPREHN